MLQFFNIGKGRFSRLSDNYFTFKLSEGGIGDKFPVLLGLLCIILSHRLKYDPGDTKKVPPGLL